MYDYRKLPEYSEAAEAYQDAMLAVDTCQIGTSKRERTDIRWRLENMFKGALVYCSELGYRVADGKLTDKGATEAAKRALTKAKDKIRETVSAAQKGGEVHAR